MTSDTTARRKQDWLDLNARYVMPGRVALFTGMGVPLVIGRREGYRLWDLDGHCLYDLHLNGGVFNLGHLNPELVETLVEAARRLDIGNHHFPSVERARLAEELARLTPGDLQYSVFTSGGSEAIDVAIKSARHATQRRKVVALAEGYHGRTGLSGAAGDDEAARYFLSDRPEEFVKVPFNDLGAMEQALAAGDVAAVVIETIPATSGFPLPEPGYLPGVKALCDRQGTLYVADEVQTGLGRTGSLWGVDTYGVQPDILVAGKGLSGGLYPISVAVLSPRAGGWLTDNGWGHVSTFGGSELGCVVAGKVLEITTRPDTISNAARVADVMGKELRGIRSRHPFLAEIRACGLVFGLRFDHSLGGMLMARALYEAGVWAMPAGFDRSVIQWKPGLLLDESSCGDILERFEQAITKVEQSGKALAPSQD